MSSVDTTPSSVAPDPARDGDPPDGQLVEEDLVIEEISIDGMCGVY